jgi:dolichol-phosphate mannosyltransferase
MARVSVVVPTYNERENIRPLVDGVFEACRGANLEVVVADDGSPDGTAAEAEALAKRYPVVVIRRTGERGLSPAVLEGFSRASGSIIGVMDADLSHPHEVLPSLIKKIDGGCDVVFASRHIPGGGMQNWPFHRRLVSRLAALFAKPLSNSTDPMSGFFMFRREVIDGVKLNPLGFKIGLEILVKCKYKNYGEVPYVFRNRAAGESKLDARQYVNYLRHLARLYAFRLKWT